MEFLIPLFAPVMGLLNRWRGGWNVVLPNIPHSLKRILISMLFAGAVILMIGGHPVWPALFAAFMWAGWAPGWGSYMDMGKMPASDNDMMKPVLDLFFRNESFFLRDFIGMTLRGLVLTLPCSGILGIWAGWETGLVFGLSGLGMGLMYWLGWLMPLKIENFRQGPEVGEVLWGAYLWLALWVSCTYF